MSLSSNCLTIYSTKKINICQRIAIDKDFNIYYNLLLSNKQAEW